MPEISFKTSTYAPPHHEVTMRDSLDGWGIDYHGDYKEGAWQFDLTDPKYAAGFGFKFYLTGGGWMNGPNLVVAASSTDVTYEGAQVTFPVDAHQVRRLDAAGDRDGDALTHRRHPDLDAGSSAG